MTEFIPEAGTSGLAHALANYMARHILGNGFCAADETCAGCIDACEKALAVLHEEERERCAEIADNVALDCTNTMTFGVASEIASKIRSGE